MFRRRRPPRDTDADLEASGPTPNETVEEASAPRPQGPWDVADVPDEHERFDLGALRILVPENAEVQVEVSPDGQAVPTVMIGKAAVQLSVFAAPRNEGIWDEVRAEIAESLRADGGSAEEAEGPFGTELRAQVVTSGQAGRSARAPARFIGVDGPRWFFRGLFTGAIDSPSATALEAVIRNLVVVRGGDAMAPRDPLPVALPREMLEAAGVPADQVSTADPMRRGPEITEVR